MKGGKSMKDGPLINKSKIFALEVLKVCKELRATKCEGVLINQFIRSGTSIGANISEAQYPQSYLICSPNLKLPVKNALKLKGG